MGVAPQIRVFCDCLHVRTTHHLFALYTTFRVLFFGVVYMTTLGHIHHKSVAKTCISQKRLKVVYMTTLGHIHNLCCKKIGIHHLVLDQNVCTQRELARAWRPTAGAHVGTADMLAEVLTTTNPHARDQGTGPRDQGPLIAVWGFGLEGLRSRGGSSHVWIANNRRMGARL